MKECCILVLGRWMQEDSKFEARLGTLKDPVVHHQQEITGTRTVMTIKIIRVFFVLV